MQSQYSPFVRLFNPNPPSRAPEIQNQPSNLDISYLFAVSLLAKINKFKKPTVPPDGLPVMKDKVSGRKSGELILGEAVRLPRSTILTEVYDG